jgi:hypothetical protein
VKLLVSEATRNFLLNQLAPNKITSSLTELKSGAAKFRLAIERCERRRLVRTFQDFPTGSCGDAALLLRAFLQEQGLGTFAYILGWRETDRGWGSHAWLEAAGVIVDITADQFPEIDEKVIVGGSYPLSHLYGHFGLVRLSRLEHDVPWTKA